MAPMPGRGTQVRAGGRVRVDKHDAAVPAVAPVSQYHLEVAAVAQVAIAGEDAHAVDGRR